MATPPPIDTAPTDPNGDVFRLLFERSADAMTLFDPARGVFIDSNAASQAALRATSREQVVNTRPEDLAPPFQPDGRPSKLVAEEAARLAMERGSHRFEWRVIRFDGTEATLEVAVTRLNQADRVLLLTVSRDISDRKRAEEEIRSLNASLEVRIARRTAELAASEARLRTLVEHAPEAIVVFDAETGLFLDCNENATRIFGLSREALLKLGPWDISPERQPDGRLSLELAREFMGRVRAGETPVFQWMHRHANGRPIPCEVRLVSLPANGRHLVRGSVLDNTERHRRALIQQATYDIAEAALGAGDLPGFYARVHGIVKRLMPAAGFCVALTGPEPEGLRFVCRRDERPPSSSVIAADTARIQQVLAEKVPLRFRQDGSPWVLAHPAASWLGVPLSDRDGIQGVMAVMDHLNVDAYGDDEQQLLTFVAGQVAQAVQRKKAEQDLRRSEEKFKMLFERSPLGISRVDWNGRFLHVNQAFAQAVGYTVAELLEMTYWDITPHHFEKDELAVLEGVRAHGFFGPFEKEYIHRDGHLVAIALYAVLVRTPDGEEQLWGITENITERRRAEQALRVSEQNFRALFESSSQGVMLHDEDQFVRVNEAAARIFGCRPEDLVGKHPRDLSAPVQPDGESSETAAARHIGDCMRDGQARFEWVSRRVDGSDVPLDVVLTRICIGGKDIIQAMVTDISRRKRTEEELRRSEEKFKQLYSMAPLGIGQVEMDGRFVHVNAALAQMVGYTPDEVCALSYWDLTPKEYEQAELEVLEQIRRTGRFGPHEKEYIHKAGHRVPVVLNGMLVQSTDGRQQLWGIIEDITARKRAEIELRNALERERELSQLKSSFVSMVSHEFRTPLGIIQSSADILADYLDQLDPLERRDHLKSIRRNIRRMAGLMEEVLVLGRLDAGRMPFQPVQLDLAALCARIVDEILSATDQRCPVRLGRLGETPLPPLALADEQLLRHILANLLANAVKYSEPDSPVTLAVDPDGTDAVFTVSDRGIGIPESDVDGLFSAFQRGSNVGQRPGTGLGLVIVKRCVDLHGGTISLTSRPGQGTTVTVRLSDVFPPP
jgi:PAS domain S-box-containing protein